MSSNLEIQELDAEGRLVATFEYDTANKAVQVRRENGSARSASLVTRLMNVFLPAGYPSSVTADYTEYQIYDTLQAFASTIAGLLASRAVFVGMGVGSEDASLVTTMLLYIAQETIGRVATILFAYRFSQRIEAEVKFYRFFADIVNDVAFVLDCLSPGLPVHARIFTLCVSNACRAVCGVSGGSSKAILSAHFAQEGNIGELNAKDGSQEMVVSLVGMWMGGLVVSKVHGNFGTWCCLIPLLALHLWANWKAVCSVRLTSLNHGRALILFTALLQGQLKDIHQVGKEESILGLSSGVPNASSIFRVGVSVGEFLDALPATASSGDSSFMRFGSLLDVFQDEGYVLWCDAKTRRGLVLLKDVATNETQAKAACHFLRLSRALLKPGEPVSAVQRQEGLASSVCNMPPGRPPHENKFQPGDDRKILDAESRSLPKARDDGERILRLIVTTLQANREGWQTMRGQIEQAGWDLHQTNLSRGRCPRLRLTEISAQRKKNQ